MCRVVIYMLLLVLVGDLMYSQTGIDEDYIRFEYSVLPELGDTDIEEYRLNLQKAFQFNKIRATAGLSYSKLRFQFYDINQVFDESTYEDADEVSLFVGMHKRLKSNWIFSLNLRPTLSSNFASSLTDEDFILNAGVAFTKLWADKNRILSLGLVYNTLLGTPLPFPFLIYRTAPNLNWTIQLGIPRTEVFYNVNQRNRVAVRAGLRGFYINNSETVRFGELGSYENSKLRLNGLDLGLMYQFRLQPQILTILKFGYIPWSRMEIISSDQDLIYDFAPTGGAYLNLGLKFNINKV